MKIDRLFGILAVLLEQDRVKAKELAERFEVSVRTIHRDVATIERAGIPIVTYPGSGGGIGILTGYKLDKRLLSRQDLAAITAGLAGIGSIGSDTRLQTLLAKLAPDASSSVALENDVIIDFSSWDHNEVLTGKIERLRRAIADSRCVDIRYVSGNGRSRRTVEPSKIVFKARGWYLYAFCRLRGEYRLFKLSRIAEMEVTEPFAPRTLTEMDLRWDDSNEEERMVRAVLRFHPSEEYQLMDMAGPEGYQTLPDGRLEAVLEQVEPAWLEQYVLAQSETIELVEPVWLRRRLADRGRKLYERYQR